MESYLLTHVKNLIERYPQLSKCENSILEAYMLLEATFESDNKLLVAGNGGSAADAEHITGELMKRFSLSRPIGFELKDKLCRIDPIRGKKLAVNLERGLMTIPLVSHEALYTAYINDVDGEGVFAQQIMNYGRSGDAFLGISTSGNSQNIINATILAHALDIKTIGLTGEGGGELGAFADIMVRVPEKETYLIQELHLPIYHCWCLMLEKHFFGVDTSV